jgi:hypothetical protein
VTSEAAHAEGIDIVELPLMHLMYKCVHDSSSHAASREKANREKARESKCTGGGCSVQHCRFTPVRRLHLAIPCGLIRVWKDPCTEVLRITWRFDMTVSRGTAVSVGHVGQTTKISIYWLISIKVIGRSTSLFILITPCHER